MSRIGSFRKTANRQQAQKNKIKELRQKSAQLQTKIERHLTGLQARKESHAQAINKHAQLITNWFDRKEPKTPEATAAYQRELQKAEQQMRIESNRYFTHMRQAGKLREEHARTTADLQTKQQEPLVGEWRSKRTGKILRIATNPAHWPRLAARTIARLKKRKQTKKVE